MSNQQRGLAAALSCLTALACGATAVCGVERSTETLKTGALYCVSLSALKDYIKAQNDPDDDRSRDGLYKILWVRKACDFAQGPVKVEIMGRVPPGRKVKVVDTSSAWKRKSKVQLQGPYLYVRP
jgi:hypothetical protein